jgi:hypothetical protein
LLKLVKTFLQANKRGDEGMNATSIIGDDGAQVVIDEDED